MFRQLRQCLAQTKMGHQLEALSQVSKASTYKKPSSKKAVNASAARRWNKENELIYGAVIDFKKRTKLKEFSTEAKYSKEFDSKSTPIIPDIPVDEVVKNENHFTSIEANALLGMEQKSKISIDISPINRFPLFFTGSEPMTQDLDPEHDLSILAKHRTVSVSQVLTKTKTKDSEFALKRWISGQIETLGKEGFAAAQNERLKVASTFHGCLEQYLTGTPTHLLNIDSLVEPYWQSISSTIQSLDEVLGVEVTVSHTKLKYHGTADCIAYYKGEPCVVEWKTSSKAKPAVSSLFDYPMQVAAYLGGLQCNAETLDIDVTKIINMLIVVAYEDGSPAHAHFIPRTQCLKFWTSWCQRLEMFWRMKLSGEI